MRANCPQQPVRSIGHVTIVAKRTRRIALMMGMCRQILRVILMTIQTSLVSASSFFELFIRITFVHRMASDAGQLTFLITSAFDQAIEFAAGDTNHSIGPKEIV